MKYLVIIILLIILAGGGYFLYTKYSQPTPQATTSANKPVSCLTGIDGNAGDNYCSNYRGTASKCRPGFDSDYPDGCTK